MQLACAKALFVMLTYKRKIKLTKVQEERISSWIGACRLVYNMGMEIKKETYKNKQINVSGYDLMKQLTEIKDTEWIADVPSQSLQNSLERLDRSYKNFFRTFKTGGGFPKFKSKRTYNSILFKSAELISKQTIKLPKIGEVTFFKDKCHVIGKIKTATIIKEPTGFFICIVCDEVSKNISNTNESQVIGIDMGVANFCVDSKGNLIENPRHFKKYEAKLRIENRSLSRKKKFSSRWKKQAKKLGLLHHKIANFRKDFLHKESTIMAKKYHTVYLEDLYIKNMSKNKNLSKHILDCGWGMFRTMLEYKTNVFRVNPKYTSQTCNECGTKDAKNRLTQSEFVCKNCGHISHADVNAAKNIMSKGIALNRKREALACALVEEPRFL
jgi:putative transposase